MGPSTRGTSLESIFQAASVSCLHIASEARSRTTNTWPDTSVKGKRTLDFLFRLPYRQEMVPESRIRTLTGKEVNPRGDFVLYWMTAFRRVRFNFSLERAVDWARQLHKPLLILEDLRCDHPMASARFHHFLVDGMIDNGRQVHSSKAVYYPYLEPDRRHGEGLLSRLGDQSCLVVTDDFPSVFLTRRVAAADGQVSVRLEMVDSNGILPVGSSGRVFERAYSFRRYLQKELCGDFPDFPASQPLQPTSDGGSLQDLVRSSTLERWPAAPLPLVREHISALPIDSSIPPVELKGGGSAATQTLDCFLARGLDVYQDSARHPDLEATSRLSPYLHVGHISTHEILERIMRKEEWSPFRLVSEARGQRQGWWGMRASTEAFLDQLLTWRELGFHACRHSCDYARYGCLPEWAQETLAMHQGDPRPHCYSLRELETAKTHDRLWNAAQNQLVGEGYIHNYLRMLWGKKILEWSPRPQTALRRMITLNDKYALDGRDPNSYSGITWILGRYDRAWGPQRPIFGKVRYMSSENTARKVKVRQYLARYAPG